NASHHGISLIVEDIHPVGIVVDQIEPLPEFVKHDIRRRASERYDIAESGAGGLLGATDAGRRRQRNDQQQAQIQSREPDHEPILPIGNRALLWYQPKTPKSSGSCSLFCAPAAARSNMGMPAWHRKKGGPGRLKLTKLSSRGVKLLRR